MTGAPMGSAVVTGGAGFLGTFVARRLAAAGTTVRLVDVAPRPADIGIDVDHVRVDVADRSGLERALAGADVVVHAAFASPRSSVERIRAVNVEGTRHLCAAAAEAGAARVVVVSSTIVTRRPRWHPVASSGLGRLEAYRLSRQEAEEVALSSVHPGFDVAVARPKTFLGPGRVGAFALVFDMIRRGKSVPVLGDGQNRYQLLAVGDLVEALVCLTRSGAGVYSLGATRFGSVAEDLSGLLDHARTGARLRFVPRHLARAGLAAMGAGGLTPGSEWYWDSAHGRDSVVDCTRARTELAWEPGCSNVAALIGAYDWYESQWRRSRAVPTTHPVPLSHRMVRRALELVLR